MNNKLLKLKIVFTVLALAVTASLMFFLKDDLDEPRPPGLSMEHQGLKGFIGADRNFFSFTEADFERIGEFETADRRPMGIQYYYDEKNISFKDIIESIKPDLENECIVVTYLSELEKFHTYPKGPFQGTEMVVESLLDSFEVPSAQSFLIVCTQETETIGIKHSTEKPSDFRNSFDWRVEGWHLTVFSSSEALADSVSACANRVKSIWVQDAENHFSKTELESPKLAHGYYLAWLKLDGHPNSCEKKRTNLEEGGNIGNGAEYDKRKNGNNGNLDGSDGNGADASTDNERANDSTNGVNINGTNTNREGADAGDDEPAGLTIYQHLNRNYDIDENRLKER